MRRVVFGLAAVTAAAAACKSLSPLESSGPGDAGADAAPDTADAGKDATVDEGHEAAPGDASGGGDAGDVDAALNLLSNSGFTNGAAGCGVGWSGYSASLQRSSDARMGKDACIVCPTGAGGGVFTTSAGLNVHVDAGESYAGIAWTKLPGAATGDASTYVQFGVAPADGGPNENVMSPDFPLTGTWTRNVLTTQVTDDGSLILLVYSTGSDCFLVATPVVVRQ